MCEPALGLVDVRLEPCLVHQCTTLVFPLPRHVSQTLWTSTNGWARSCARVFQYKHLINNPRWKAIASPAATAMTKLTGMR